MTSAELIREINSLSDDASKKVNVRRAIINRELNNIESNISSINEKIDSHQSTITDLRKQLLDKTLEATGADGEELSRIKNDKKALQLGLAKTRQEHQSLISKIVNYKVE